MKNDDIFTTIIERIDDAFMEIDSEAAATLQETDEEYAAMRERMTELSAKFPAIEPLVNGSSGNRTLSAEECVGLAEYLRLSHESENRERLNLYYLGHRDCFAYLKRIGAI